MPEGIDFLPMILKMNVLNSIFYKREMFQPKYWVEIKYLGAIKASTFSQYRQKSQELEADRLYPLISIIKFEKLLKRFATIANLFDVNLRITHSCCYKFSFFLFITTFLIHVVMQQLLRQMPMYIEKKYQLLWHSDTEKVNNYS